MTTIRAIHASGRFDQSPDAFDRALTRYRNAASAITVTEVDANARAVKLDAPGWQSVHGDKGPRDDCGIAWETATWTKLWAGTLPLSHRTYVNERHRRTGVTAGAFAVLEHRATGRRVVFAVVHTPHGMQDELRARRVRSDVGLAYVSITRAYRQRGQRLADKFRADAMVLDGDWNLNLRAAWVRAWFAAYVKGTGLRLNWRRPYPQRGTHGKELIDATLFKGLRLLAPPSLCAPDPTDDHRAYMNVFNLV